MVKFMKTRIYLTLIVIATLFTISCGSKSNLIAKKISTDKVVLYGEHKDYTSIVSDSCTIRYNFNSNGTSAKPTITLTFDLNEKTDDLKGFKPEYNDIKLNLVDEYGAVISFDEFVLKDEHYKFTDLFKGSWGDEINVTFTTSSDCDADQIEMINASAVSFEVINLNFTKISQSEINLLGDKSVY